MFIVNSGAVSQPPSVQTTSQQKSDREEIDSRTILNIENYRGNPKMTVLFPLVRGLQIDSQEIFYPGMERKSPSVSQLRFLVEDCTEQEAAALIPVVQSFLGAVRSNTAAEIK